MPNPSGKGVGSTNAKCDVGRRRQLAVRMALQGREGPWPMLQDKLICPLASGNQTNNHQCLQSYAAAHSERRPVNRA